MANLVKESEKQRSVIDNIMLSVASPFLHKRCSYCGLEIDNGEGMRLARAPAASVAPVPPFAIDNGSEAFTEAGVAQSIPPPVLALAKSPSVGVSTV